MSVPSRSRVLAVAVVAAIGVLAVSLVGLGVGPFHLSVGSIASDIGSHLGLGGTPLDELSSTVLWQLRAPRIVLALLVGTMLAVAGGTYQGVFRNPLADPYLLGVAAGAGLGATLAIVGIGDGVSTPTWTPWLAFAGALLAVAVVAAIGVLAVCLVGLGVGPFHLSVGSIVSDIGSHLGLGGTPLDELSSTVLWQLRAPRIVLALLVGTMLAVAGGTYQGVFRNPLPTPTYWVWQPAPD